MPTILGFWMSGLGMTTSPYGFGCIPLTLTDGSPGRAAEFRTMVRYGLVGLANTGVFSLCAWLLSKTGLHYAAYTAIAYAIAIGFSFLANSLFTFRTAERNGRTFVRFVLVTLSLLACVQVIQYVLIDELGVSEIVGIVSGMVFYTGIGYVLNRYWTFRRTDN